MRGKLENKALGGSEAITTLFKAYSEGTGES